MVRALIGCVLVLFCATVVLAVEKTEPKKVEGKLKSVDPEKKTLTITVDDKDRDFTIPDDAKMLVNDIRSYEPKDRLKDPAFERKGVTVVVTIEQKDGKDVVKEVVVNTGRKG